MTPPFATADTVSVGQSTIRYSSASAQMVSNRSLVENTLWNLAGSAAPLFVAAFCIPVLIRGLGIERFGILTLAWTVIGYLSLFDFGLGRALTKLVAEKLSLNEIRDIPCAFWDSLFLLLGVGCIGALSLAGLAPWLVTHMLNAPAELKKETVYAFYYMAAALPVVTTAAGLRGFLEAKQHFLYVNVIRMLTGVLGFIGPVSALSMSHHLDAMIGILAATRFLTWAFYFATCVYAMPELWTQRSIGKTPLKPLLHFGGWLTISNLLSPIMVSMDRFIIGGLLSIGVVAYYVTPSEMMMKVLVLPAALQTVLFPAFSGALCRDSKRADELYSRGNKAMFLSIFPVTVLVVSFSHDLLRLWLGEQFADKSTLVLQLLAVGILINAVGHIPSILVQSVGRPDLSAKLKLIEVPVYLAMTWWLILHWGINGAAVAWTLRVLLDSTLLFAISRRWVPKMPFTASHIGIASAIVGTAFLLTALRTPLALLVGFNCAVLIGTAKLARPMIQTFLQAGKRPC